MADNSKSTGGPGGISDGGIKNAEPRLTQDYLLFSKLQYVANADHQQQYYTHQASIGHITEYGPLQPLLNLWQNYKIDNVSIQYFPHSIGFQGDIAGLPNYDFTWVFFAYPWNRATSENNIPYGFCNKGMRYKQFTESSIDWSVAIWGGDNNKTWSGNPRERGYYTCKSDEPLEISAPPMYEQVTDQIMAIDPGRSNTVQSQPVMLHGKNGLDQTQWYYAVSEFEFQDVPSLSDSWIWTVRCVEKFTITFTGPQYSEQSDASLQVQLAEQKLFRQWKGQKIGGAKQYFDHRPWEHPKSRPAYGHGKRSLQMVDDHAVERGHPTEGHRNTPKKNREDGEVPSPSERCGPRKEQQSTPTRVADGIGRALQTQYHRTSSTGTCVSPGKEESNLVRDFVRGRELHQEEGNVLDELWGGHDKLPSKRA